MNVLDEQVIDSQRLLLRSWRIAVRQIGYDVGRKGLKDYQIIPFLIRLRRVTFFTLDFHFHKRDLCHTAYSLICLDVRKEEAATYARRVLRQPEFSTIAKRMGKVIRASSIGLAFWRLHAEREEYLEWDV
jgi:hypothetical protein